MARIARRAKRTLDADTTRPNPTAGGMTTGAERSEHRKGQHPCPPAGGGARGETPRPYIELRAIRPVEIREATSVLDTKNMACYPPKTTLRFYPQKSEFWGDIR